MGSILDKNFARAAGALLGASLALLFLIVARPGAEGPSLPATARFSIAASGELATAPVAPRHVLIADSLLPGGEPAVARFQIRNQTGVRLAVGLLTDADSTALDGILVLRLSGGGKLLAETTLQGMRLRPVRFALDSGESIRLRLEASIPGDVLSDYEGRVVDVSMVPRTRPIEGRR
jgi:hypothetical protein